MGLTTCTTGGTGITLFSPLPYACPQVLTGVTFLGDRVFARGLLRETSYDAHSFTDTMHLHPQQPWERNLGDCHFETLERFFTPVQNQPGRVRTAAEEEYNAMLQHVRARVEHINRTIKAHAMFTGVPYRGYVRNLAVFVKITLHATAELLRQRRIKFGPRYEGFGPHWHNPAQRDE